MHTLSRRESSEQSREHRYVLMPRRPAGSTGVIRSDGPREEAPRPRTSAPAPRRRPTPIAVRRRRVLASLLGTTLVLALASSFTPVPWWVAGLSLLLAVGYVVHLRVQARRRLELRRRRAAASRTAEARLARLDSADRVFAVRSDRLSAQLAEVRAAAAEATRAAADAVTTRVADRAASTAARPAAGDGWEPVPVPLPTYVTKPKAVRPARALDLSSAGVWSSARAEASESVYDDRALDLPSPEGAAAAGPVLDLTDTVVDLTDEDDELDAILERRRAVND